MKVTAVSAVGTLAYIIEEEALLVRVNNGWQYIAVSSSSAFLSRNEYDFFVITEITTKKAVLN